MIFSKYLAEIKKEQELLKKHSVFDSIKTIEDLRFFMECHVFAVWDFMCLVKRLQRDLTSIDLIWLPSDNHLSTRLINEIVLGEESDIKPDGSSISHFELYLSAMEEVGADTRKIKGFIELIKIGVPVNEAMEKLSINLCVQDFVNNTIHTVINGTIHEVLGSFFFGREDVIPAMFKSLLDSWHIDEKKAPMFLYYLNRHIELDGDEHGPAIMKIIEDLTYDQVAIYQLQSSALGAIKQRYLLWEGILSSLSLKLDSLTISRSQSQF